MPRDRAWLDEDRAVIVGKSGSGKSYFAEHVIAPQLVRDCGRLVIWSPKPTDYVTLDPRRVTLDEFSEAIEELAESDGWTVAVTEWPMDEYARAQAFYFFVQAMQALGDCACIVDEIGLLPRQAWPYIEYIACLSRGWGVPLVMVAQGATQIPRRAREQATRIWSFRQNSIDDAAALGRLMGEAKAARITTLPRREYVAWHESDAEGVTERQNAPRKRKPGRRPKHKE